MYCGPMTRFTGRNIAPTLSEPYFIAAVFLLLSYIQYFYAWVTYFLLFGHLGSPWAKALSRSTSAGNIPLADWGRTQSLPVSHHVEAGCSSLSPARKTYLYPRHTFLNVSDPSLIEKTLAANIRSDSVATESRIMGPNAVLFRTVVP
jgi:hypothetical protein